MKRLNDPGRTAGQLRCLGHPAAGAPSWGRSCGSCRPTSTSIPPSSTPFSACCRAIPTPPLRVGRRHDQRLKARAWLRAGPRRQRLRHALEVRHESFCDPAFIELLRRHDIALVCADTVDWPLLMDLTSASPTCRLHGSRELYRSGYSAAELGPLGEADRAPGVTASRCATAPSSARRGRAPGRVRLLSTSTTPTSWMAPRDAQALMRRLEEA